MSTTPKSTSEIIVIVCFGILMAIGLVYLAYEGGMWLFGEQEIEEFRQADEEDLPDFDSSSVLID